MARFGIEAVGGLPVGYAVFGEPMESLSSAVLNGGDSVAEGLMIMQVPRDYDCTEPAGHAAGVRDALGLPASTVGMMTAADVDYVYNMAEGEFNGTRVVAIATAGLSNHVVAGEELTDWPERRAISEMRSAMMRAGTINIAVISPVPLTMEGKVNLFIPLVEAKSAAMAERGFRETGTTSDAMAVLSPMGGGRVSYTGTGSDIGIAAARAVRQAVGYALDRRGEHPVPDTAAKALSRLGYDEGSMYAMSGMSLPPEEFRERLDRLLSDRGVRTMVDLAIHVSPRADALLADGDAGDKLVIERMIRDLTSLNVDVDEGGLMRAIAEAIARKAGS